MKQIRLWGWIPFGWFLMFLLIPLSLVLIMSFLKKGTYGGIEWVFQVINYEKIIRPEFFRIFISSLWLSVITTFLCLILAYPLAWGLVTLDKKWRDRIILLLAIPFLTNLIIRIYAIKVFVGAAGPLQFVLQTLGIPYDEFSLTQNQILVAYGMITTYLPFMLFPIYISLEKMDFDIISAAQDLGARSFHVFKDVILPQSRTAMVNGILLVFIPCLGEFVIPNLLGGAKNMLIGNLITEQFLKARDWPLGSALTCVLIVLLMSASLGLNKLAKVK